jgi:hypothetical protein
MRCFENVQVVLGLVPLFCGAASGAGCVDTYPTVRQPALKYPKTSDLYAVQYQVGGGTWTAAQVYVSYYGATDHVSVRPSIKPFLVDTQPDGKVMISTFTASNFGGEQFILWWQRGTDSAGVEGLAVFLNPPYTAPAPASNVRVVNGQSDLADLTGIDTLDFEGFVQLGPGGAVAYPVPHNILTIFFGLRAWVQGKLQFNPKSVTRKIYGPGVLDVSRFSYVNRLCGGGDGLYALSSLAGGRAGSFRRRRDHHRGPQPRGRRCVL